MKFNNHLAQYIEEDFPTRDFQKLQNVPNIFERLQRFLDKFNITFIVAFYLS